MKHGRNKDKCKKYKSEGRANLNKARRAETRKNKLAKAKAKRELR